MSCPEKCPRCAGIVVAVFVDEIQYNEVCSFNAECIVCGWRSETNFTKKYSLRKPKQAKLVEEILI